MCDRSGRSGAALISTAPTVVIPSAMPAALATGGIGTALAPIYLAHRRGQAIHVVVPETRPLLQGSRLTAWELTHARASPAP